MNKNVDIDIPQTACRINASILEELKITLNNEDIMKRLIIEGNVDKKISRGLSPSVVISDYVYKLSLEDFSSILPGIFYFFLKSVPEIYNYYII